MGDRELVAGELGRDPAAVEDQRPIGYAGDLLEIRRDLENRQSVVNRLLEQPVDLRL
jgi:hypothetical protein